MGKGLELKVRKFWGITLLFVEVAGEKLVGEPFYPPPPFLNRVKVCESEMMVVKDLFVEKYVDCLFYGEIVLKQQR